MTTTMRALALLGLLLVQEPDVDALLRQLSDESIAVREKASAALIAMGEKIETKVKAFIPGAGAEAKGRAEEVLRRIARTRRIREVLPPVKSVTLKFKEASVQEVLDSFKSQTGWPIEMPKRFKRAITVDVIDVLPLQALQAVATQIGRDFAIDGERVLDQDSDIRTFDRKDKLPTRVRFVEFHATAPPTLYKSRYAVVLSRIVQQRSTSFSATHVRAELSTRLILPPDLKPDPSSELMVDSFTDDAGKVLFDRSKSTEAFPRYLGGSQCDANFAFPDPDVRALSSVKGRAVMRYLLSEKSISFESPKESIGGKRPFKNGEIVLKKWENAGAFMVVLEVPDAEWFQRECGLSIRTRNGTTHPALVLRSGRGNAIYAQFELVEDEVRSLEVLFDRDFFVDEVDFEFKDVPLP